jgi:phosphoribosylanthranilate isomerase
MKIKICGMRDSENALVAAEAGADFLGFVFVEGVRRQLLPPQGRAIIERYRHELSHASDRRGRSRNPRLVGLFRNQSADWVRRVVEECGLDIAQLNGDEDFAYGKSVGVRVLRQVRVKSGEPASSVRSRVDRSLQAGEMVLLDRDDPRVPGGGGVPFDWDAAREIGGLPDVLLGGGLNPDNVKSAIDRVKPWGVDVSSGVETAGQKDPDRIRQFVAAVRAAARGSATRP